MREVIKMTVSYNDYVNEKQVFFNKHHNDFRCETSSMDEYGRYYKTYVFADNAIWYETMSPTYEIAEVEIKLVKVQVEVKMLRTEFWNTDDANSKFYFEKF